MLATEGVPNNVLKRYGAAGFPALSRVTKTAVGWRG
jgi:hypothetical protein